MYICIVTQFSIINMTPCALMTIKPISPIYGNRNTANEVELRVQLVYGYRERIR